MPPPWSLITSHANVLAVIHSDPTMRHAEIAASVGLSTRQVTNVVADLLASGWLTRQLADEGANRWVYTVRLDVPYADRMCTAPDLARLLEIIRPKGFTR